MEQRIEQGRAVKNMPVVFNCQCARCWDCKSPETSVVQHHTFYVNNKRNVEMVTDRIPVCHNCGRPKQRTNKTYFNLQHTRLCPTHEENILPPNKKVRLGAFSELGRGITQDSGI